MMDQAERLRQLASISNENKKKITNIPKIITVTSGKGGVGKSNIVVNLSIALQKMGKKVLIFDADIGMGNDDVLMGILPKYNVFDIIYNNMSIEDVLVTGPFGVRLLPAGSGISKIEEIDDEKRNIFLDKISKLEDLDYIIMDTGAGINRTVLAFVSCCDELIILTTPEPTSLTDGYSLLKAISHFRLKQNAKVIINRVFDEKEGMLTFNKFNNAAKNFLNIELELLGFVSEDKKLTQAVRQQQPLLLIYPKSDVSYDIYNIAKSLEGTNDEHKQIGVQGLFKKLFDIFS